MSEKVKFALYLPPEKKMELERRCREDGSRSITVFVERAIDFYLSYLIDADYLRRLRANSVRNVKATNGLLTFEQKARAYDDYAEGDDQWHG